MEGGIDLDKIDIIKFARSIERDCQEGVKWGAPQAGVDFGRRAEAG